MISDLQTKKDPGPVWAEALRAMRPGSWQLKYSPKNAAGARLWQKIKRRYNGVEQPLPDGHIAISFS